MKMSQKVSENTLNDFRVEYSPLRVANRPVEDAHTSFTRDMLRQSDSTFLPVSALTTTLIGSASPASFRASKSALSEAPWAGMSIVLLRKILRHDIWHHGIIGRAKISITLSKLSILHKWIVPNCKSILNKSVNKKDSLNVASRAYAMDVHNELGRAKSLRELNWTGTRDENDLVYERQKEDVLI